MKVVTLFVMIFDITLNFKLAKTIFQNLSIVSTSLNLGNKIIVLELYLGRIQSFLKN